MHEEPENFTGLLKLRYMSLPAAIRALGFADAAEAVAYYADQIPS